MPAASMTGGLDRLALAGPCPFQMLRSIPANTERERPLPDRADQQLKEDQDGFERDTHVIHIVTQVAEDTRQTESDMSEDHVTTRRSHTTRLHTGCYFNNRLMGYSETRP